MLASSQITYVAPTPGPYTMGHTTPGSQPELRALALRHRATRVSMTLCTIHSSLGCAEETREQSTGLQTRFKMYRQADGKLLLRGPIDAFDLQSTSL